MQNHTLAKLIILALLLSVILPIHAEEQKAASKFDPDNAFFALPLKGFFPGKTKKGELKTLNFYGTRRNGVWSAALGTATNNGKPVWNGALMPIDPTDLKVTKDSIVGTIKVTLVPDPWVPNDQKVREATLKIDGKIGAGRNNMEIAHASGSWTATIDEGDETLKAAGLAAKTEGQFNSGGLAGVGQLPVDNHSYDFTVFNLVSGKAYETHHTRHGVSIGVTDGKPSSLRTATIGLRGKPDVYTFHPLNIGKYEIHEDSFILPVKFKILSLDGDLLDYSITFEGKRIVNWLVGKWSGTAINDSGKEIPVSGFFRGDVRKGAARADKVDPRPWYNIVPDFSPPSPGEHPRLFFRKEDVAELRRRAATPEGQEIIELLRKQLNGSDGKTMPTSYNPAKLAYPYKGKKVPKNEQFKPEMGTYTITHAAGYGFLYQLTGDQLYADLARQCVEKGLEGQRGRDPRYSWVNPGGELRAGPSIGWTAVAYDLCYDGWDKEFRRKIALAIQNYNSTGGGEWDKPQEGGISLRKLVFQPRHGPISNHFGAVVGGSGLAILAILNDPGTDEELLEKYRKVMELQVVRSLSAGWGDGGYYKEGWGASRVGTQSSMLPLLQAMRNVLGHDYLNVERTNASAITMIPRSLMVLGNPAIFPYRSNMGSTYGRPEIGKESDNETITRGGYFSEGFGAIKDKHIPALLWTYENSFKDEKHLYDLRNYPHRTMLALINWPTFRGIKPKNPAEVMPLTSRDSLYDYFVFRNRFQDKNDIITTVLINQPKGTKPRNVMVWGLDGMRINMSEPQRAAEVKDYVVYKDGSAVLSAGNFAMAVDYTGTSGADAIIVTTEQKKESKGKDKTSKKSQKPPIAKDSKKASYTELELENTLMKVLVLSSENSLPDVSLDGSTLKVGDQKITYDQGRFRLATHGEELK